MLTPVELLNGATRLKVARFSLSIQDTRTFQQLHQLTRPLFSVSVFTALLVCYRLGQRPAYFRSVYAHVNDLHPSWIDQQYSGTTELTLMPPRYCSIREHRLCGMTTATPSWITHRCVIAFTLNNLQAYRFLLLPAITVRDTERT